MIEIEDKLVSDEVVEQYFMCDLSKCKGACCVYGDSGAPLKEQEIGVIEESMIHIRPYMTQKGLDAVDKQGVFVIDGDGDYTTTLVDDSEECAFTFENEDGVVLCAIEKAYREGKISFKKPISCHLYPIRANKYSEENIEVLNYHRWGICKDAVECGERCGVKVYQGVKDAVEREWGSEFYSHLVEVDRIIANGELEEV